VCRFDSHTFFRDTGSFRSDETRSSMSTVVSTPLLDDQESDSSPPLCPRTVCHRAGSEKGGCTWSARACGGGNRSSSAFASWFATKKKSTRSSRRSRPARARSAAAFLDGAKGSVGAARSTRGGTDVFVVVAREPVSFLVRLRFGTGAVPRHLRISPRGRVARRPPRRRPARRGGCPPFRTRWTRRPRAARRPRARAPPRAGARATASRATPRARRPPNDATGRAETRGGRRRASLWAHRAARPRRDAPRDPPAPPRARRSPSSSLAPSQVGGGRRVPSVNPEARIIEAAPPSLWIKDFADMDVSLEFA
jgi:hypothetical protein